MDLLCIGVAASIARYDQVDSLPVVQDDAFQPFDFTTLLNHGIEGHLEALTAISLRASKEAGLERALAAMRADWDGVAFAVHS